MRISAGIGKGSNPATLIRMSLKLCADEREEWVGLSKSRAWFAPWSTSWKPQPSKHNETSVLGCRLGHVYAVRPSSVVCPSSTSSNGGVIPDLQSSLRDGTGTSSWLAWSLGFKIPVGILATASAVRCFRCHARSGYYHLLGS